MKFEFDPDQVAQAIRERLHSKIGDEVSVAELFTPEFLRAHSRVRTLGELAAAGGLSMDQGEEFAEAVKSGAFDETVRQVTDFATWMAGAEGRRCRLRCPPNLSTVPGPA